MKTFFIIINFLIISQISNSQDFSTLRIEKYRYKDTLKLHYSIVVPQTIEVFVSREKINKNKWHYDLQKSEIILDTIIKSEITVKYRIIKFKTDFFVYKNQAIVPQISKDGQKVSIPAVEECITTSSDIVKQGEIMRGLTVGNNQDPVLNSSLNLKLAGKLSSDLSIKAKISDRTLPVQADGNTAKIQDFNKMYIKIYNDNNSLEAGDVDISANARFLKYHKQVKGIVYGRKIIRQDSTYQNFSFGTAVCKGNFRRQYIQGIEGNQGPYKLFGANGETYILVLSASEKVYLDGKLLKRGAAFDYTINYNMAEITFTAKIPITKDSRIIVEFEYYNRDYNRFSFFANAFFANKNSAFYFNYFEQKDAKNQSIDMVLTDSLKKKMYMIGDSLNKAEIDNSTKIKFTDNKILYQKKDTIVDSRTYRIYVYCSKKNKQLYDVRFSYTGEKTGNYVIDKNNVNGRIYKWIAPENGVPQGQYSAKIRLVAPQKHSIGEFGTELKLSKKNKINFSIAASNTDLNLFSPFDDNNNLGAATAANFVHFFTKKSAFSLLFSFVNKNFSPIETFRPQEFFRNWNIDSAFNTNEKFAKIEFYSNKAFSNKALSFSILNYSKNYTGLKSKIRINRVERRLAYNIDAFYLHSQSTKNYSDFVKSNFKTDIFIGKYALGFRYTQETDIFRQSSNFSIDKKSRMFHSVGFIAKSKDSLKNPIQISYDRRFDFLPDTNKMFLVDYSDNFLLSSSFKNKKIYSNFILNYRKLNVLDSNMLNQKPQNFIAVRDFSSLSFFNGAISSSFSAELSSGMQQKMQYVFVEVKPGLGNYRWIDYNSDKIKQIDEFQPAFYSDQANYIRVNIQSNQYVRVFNKKSSFFLNISPAKFFSKKNDVQKFFSRTNNRTSIVYECKTNSENLMYFSDSKAIVYNLIFNNVFSINPLSGLFFNYNFYSINAKNTLLAGINDKIKNRNEFLTTYRWRELMFSYKISFQKNKQQTDYSLINNYLIKTNLNQIKIIYSKKNTEILLNYLYSDGYNKIGVERNISNRFSFRYRYFINETIDATVELERINNNFRGNSNTAAAYIMLEGLHRGLNYTWEISIRKKLYKYFSLQLDYQGRYSREGRVIHTGTFNIVAYL